MKAKRTIATMELTEQDIPLMKGKAYDMPVDGHIYRGLEDWFVTKSNSTLPIRFNLEQLKPPGPYILRGKLVAQQNGFDNIPVRINFDGRWSVERNSELRGIWVQTERAWYWLKRPCSLQRTCSVHVTVNGTREESTNSCVATFPSQDERHLELRAKLGLVSNLCDLFLFDESPDSLDLLKRHIHKNPDDLHEELKPSPELLAKFPDRSPEAFDLQLLKDHAQFITSHFLGFHEGFPNKCVFVNGLKQISVNHRRECSMTRDELLASALAAEHRGGRYPWGELRLDATQQRVNPNWVYAERLHEAATETRQRVSKRKATMTTTTDATPSPRLKRKRMSTELETTDASSLSPRLKKKRADAESGDAVKVSRKRVRKVPPSEIINSSSEDPFDEESIDDVSATPSPRKAKKREHEAKTSPPPLRTKVTEEGLEKMNDKPRSRRKIIDSDDEDDQVYAEEPTIDNVGEDNTPEKRSREEQRMSTILAEATFQPQRVKEALHDMRPFLSNKEEREFETMADLRGAAYMFDDIAAAELFIVEKMRKTPFVIQTWEYKVLVALTFTNIYEHYLEKKDPKITTKFEKTMFGKGETKNQTPGVKIYCKTWRSEAVALFDEFEKCSKLANKGEHPLKASLLSELLLEFCTFSAKCKVLKSKAALDTIKDPSRYDIDFVEGVKQASIIAHKLMHARLTIESNKASGRFRAMIADGSHTRPAEEGTVNANLRARHLISSAETAASSSTIQAPTSDHKKAAREKRMRDMHQRLIAACTTASEDNLAERSTTAQQFKPLWGGKSKWGFPAESDNLPAESDELPSNVNSVYAWASSSTRFRYHVWGNAGESMLKRGLNTVEVKTALTSPLAEGIAGDVSIKAVAPSNPSETRSAQRLSPPTPSSKQSHFTTGVGKDHRGSGNGRGHGEHLNSPAWEMTQENAPSRDHVAPAPSESNVQRHDHSHLAQPPRSQRRGTGLGRGTHVNTPAWMTNQGSGVSIPSHEPTGSDLQTQRTVAPHAFPEARVNPSSGRGRGRAMTTPAWMTNPELNQNP